MSRAKITQNMQTEKFQSQIEFHEKMVAILMYFDFRTD